MRLSIERIGLDEANAFVAQYHRHHQPVVGHLFSIGASLDGRIVGVVIVGRPVSRMRDDGVTAEVTRLGERHIPFNPNDVPVVPFGRVEDCLPPNDFEVVSPKLVERLERTADQMARMRREQRARRRRIDFQVIAGGRQRD